MTTSTASQLLTAEDLANRWQFFKDSKPNPSPVYRLTREGKLMPVRLGRYYRYRLDAVEEFETKGGTNAA